MRRAFERYEDEIIEDERAGLIGRKEANHLHHELAIEYRNAAEDAAEDAREREHEEWYR